MQRFETTLWSEIGRAKSGDPLALLHFVNRYRPAVLSFLRSRGFSAADAEDLVQEVFLYLVRGNVLAKVDTRKGKFRSLLVSVTKHVILNDRRGRSALKRGRNARVVPLDEAILPAVEPKEEEDFDWFWARELTAAALCALEAAHPRYHEGLKRSLAGESHREIASAMGKSVAEVNNYIHRGKGWVRRQVERLVAETCTSNADLGEELKHLKKYLA